jgi:DNA polymerase-3 subunit alpha
MLAHAKATLGFYVTRHPLSSHEKTLRKYATATTADLERYADNAEVTLGGIISKMRTVVTKSGRNAGAKMGIVTLEDLCGQVEVIVFPKDLERYRAQLGLESVVFFRGRVDRKREEPSLRVSEVIPLEQADELLSTRVVLKVNCVGADASLLERVRTELSRFPGDRPVFLELCTPGDLKVTIRANGRSGVKPSSAFQEALEGVLGPDHVVIVGAGRRAVAEPAPRDVEEPPPEEEDTAGLDEALEDEAVLAE